MNGSIWLLNKWRKPLNRVEKTGAKTHFKSCLKQSIRAPFYRLGKTSRWGKTSAWTAVGRPARSTANGQKSDRWSLDRPARSTGAWNREQSTLPVDQLGRPGLSREQSSLDGRPIRSTSPPARPGVHVCARRSTDLVDRLLARSTGPVDQQKPDQNILGIKNLAF